MNVCTALLYTHRRSELGKNAEEHYLPLTSNCEIRINGRVRTTLGSLQIRHATKHSKSSLYRLSEQA